MIDEGAGAFWAGAVDVDAVVCVAVAPVGVVLVVVVVRVASAPERSPRSVSAIFTASALRRNTT
jgi:hypothetical protein